MKRIHVLHVLYSFDLGGMETGITHLINGMPPEEFKHTICIFSPRFAAAEKIEPGKKPEIFVIKRHFRHDPSVLFRLIRLIRKERPDIVSTYNWAGIEGILAALLTGSCRIIHSERGFGYEEIKKLKGRRVLGRKFLLPRCDKVVTVSDWLQNWLVKGVKVDSGKIVRLPNGCDTAHFYPGKDIQKREEMGIRENDIVIGTVGSLNKLKNPASLLSVFAGMARENSKLKLLFVGEGPQKTELKTIAQRENISEKVFFTGRVADPATYYRSMDIFVLPSLSEQYPNVILEAMASGLPIVASNVGEVRNILGGKAGGLIVEPGDDSAMAGGIRRLLEDRELAAEKGTFVRVRAETLFSLERMIKNYASLYRDVLTLK